MNFLVNTRKTLSESMRNYMLIIFLCLSGLFAFVTLSSVSAQMTNTMRFQSKIVNTNGTRVDTSTTPCVVAGPNNDTCDFRVRIWNVSTGGTVTPGNNLMYEELHQNIEIGHNDGIFEIFINSVCNATQEQDHQWRNTVAAATVCNIIDDNDTDTTPGVNFDREDLWLEVSFAPSGTWTSLASPPVGVETFSRTNLTTVPMVYTASTLSGGYTAGDFVQLAPATVQTTTKSSSLINISTTANTTNPLILINEDGAGNPDLIDLQVASSTVFNLNNIGTMTVGSDVLSLRSTEMEPTFEWVRREISGTGSVVTNGVAVGPDGSVYTVGYFQTAAVDFGSGSLTPSGDDYFLVKHDSAGNFQWVRREVGGTGSAVAQGVAVASDGSVYTVGYFQTAAVDFGSGSLTPSGDDYFLVKHDSAGNFQWVRREVGGTGSVFVLGVTAAPDGSVYTVGYFHTAAVDFGSGSLTPSNIDYFLMKHDSGGNFQWIRREAGGTGSPIARGVAVGPDGSIYTSGYFTGTVDFGGGSLVASSNDYFLVKHDSAGNFQWVRREIGGTASVVASKLAVALDGSVYTVGYFQSITDFGSGNLTPNSDDYFLVKHDSAGNFQWVRREIGGSGLARASDVIVGNDGYVYTVGYFASSSVDFGSGSLTPSGDDYFLVKHDSAGNFQWVRREIGGAGSTRANGIALASDGSVYIAGYFQSASVDFGSGLLTPSNNDYFLLKLIDTGSTLSQIGTTTTPFLNLNVVNTRTDGLYFGNRYISVRDNKLSFGSGSINVFEINNQGDIVMPTGGTKNIVNASGTNLVQIRDIAKNFGATFEAGAVVSRNSYLGEEFQKEKVTITDSQVLAWGDTDAWTVHEEANGSFDCIFGVRDDNVNGLQLMGNLQVNGGCMIYLGGTTLGTMHTIFHPNNMPLFIYKIRVSGADANKQIRAGLMSATTFAYADPTNGIFFANNAGTWEGRTTSASTTTAITCSGQTVINSQFALLKAEMISPSEVRFYVDTDVSNGISWVYCGSSVTNIPTTNLAPAVAWKSNVAWSTVGSYIDIDYMRIWQDDAAETQEEPISNPPTNIEQEPISYIPQMEQTEEERVLEVVTKITGLKFNTTDDIEEIRISSVTGGRVQIETTEVKLIGNLIINGAMRIGGDLRAKGNVNLFGGLQLGEETFGQIVLAEGEKEIRIDYKQRTEEIPRVIVHPQGEPNIAYYITEVNEEGFKIVITTPADRDVVFNWFAFDKID